MQVGRATLPRLLCGSITHLSQTWIFLFQEEGAHGGHQWNCEIPIQEPLGDQRAFQDTNWGEPKGPWLVLTALPSASETPFGHHAPSRLRQGSVSTASQLPNSSPLAGLTGCLPPPAQLNCLLLTFPVSQPGWEGRKQVKGLPSTDKHTHPPAATVKAPFSKKELSPEDPRRLPGSHPPAGQPCPSLSLSLSAHMPAGLSTLPTPRGQDAASSGARWAHSEGREHTDPQKKLCWCPVRLRGRPVWLCCSPASLGSCRGGPRGKPLLKKQGGAEAISSLTWM